MSWPTWLRLPWLFNRRVGSTLGWTLLIFAVAIAANVFGIYAAGSVERWERWLQDHAGHFFAWRLALYAATGYGWWWMRGRLLSREAEPDTYRRLLRTEIAAVVTLVLLEGGQLLRA